MIQKPDRNKNRKRRHIRVRRKVMGTPDRPRLNVFRSSNNIYPQVIDDVQGNTLVSASTLDAEVKAKGIHGGNVEAAVKWGNWLPNGPVKKESSK